MSEIKDTQQHPKVEIAVKNFGPIAEADIDLRPLTVFVGPSNTGKTYFATLVYALHSIFFQFSHTAKPIKKNIPHKLSSHHDAVELAFKRCFDVAVVVGTGVNGIGLELPESGFEAKNFRLILHDAVMKEICHRLWRNQVSVDFAFNHSATCSTCPVSNERFAASVTASVLTASA